MLLYQDGEPIANTPDPTLFGPMSNQHSPLTFSPPAPGQILVTDEDGVVVYANEGVAGRTGFAVAEIIGAKPGKLWGGQMPRPFYAKLWRQLRTEGRPFVGTVTNRTKQGKRYQEELTLSPLRDRDGQMKYLALRPAASRPEDGFLEAWQQLFRQPVLSAQKALPWLGQWFPEIGKCEIKPDETLADWMETHWIHQLQTRFQQRADDRRLVEAAQANPVEFQALYGKYYDLVHHYFSRHLAGQYDQIQDLTQDTFLRAYERLEGYEIRNAAYGTYLLRIAHSVLLNTFRRKSMLELPREISLPDTTVAAGVDWVWDTPELNPRERLVLSAYYREGFSIREISQGLEISENATKLILSRARKKIRPLLG